MKREYVAKVKGYNCHFTEWDYVGRDKMRLSASKYPVAWPLKGNETVTVKAKDVTFCYIWKFNSWERKTIKWFKKLWKR